MHAHSVQKLSAFWAKIPTFLEKMILLLVPVTPLTNSLLVILFLVLTPLILALLLKYGFIKIVILTYWVQGHAILMFSKGIVVVITRACMKTPPDFKLVIIHLHRNLPTVLCPVRSRTFCRRALKLKT